jgi:hypothetical protein
MAERNHAILSASAAHRWLTCTPSARLEQEEGQDECSVYAAEGTAAHALAEIKLKHVFGKTTNEEYEKELVEFHANPEYNKFFNKEFEEYVDSHVQFVIDETKELGDFHIFFELRVNFSSIVPQGFGTADVLIVTEDMIHVIDLKFGAGVPVSAINNSQLRLYGFGAMNLFPHTKYVKTTINQPRLESRDSELLEKEVLLEWGFDYVKPRAELAIKGEGRLMASEDACRFCKLKGKCKERADHQLSIARQEFSIIDRRETIAKVITPEQIAYILEVGPAFIDWYNDVKSFALGQLASGAKIPGFKVVEGRSNRIITDEQKVMDALLEAGFSIEEITKPRELLGISKLEALIGKKLFAEAFADYIIKPQGRLTLVPETDRRPAINTYEIAALDFAEPIE